jgi:hyperosmotically inducible periplasmic protein
MKLRHTSGLIALSSMALVFGLAGCGERVDGVHDARTEAAQARESARNEAPTDNVRTATSAAGQDPRGDNREAAADARERTANATSRMGDATSQMGAGATEPARDTSIPAPGSPARVGDRMDDMQITTRVNAGLAADRNLSAMRIDVDTKDGVVTLMGTAPSATAKARAAEIAREIRDVRSVNNQLAVAGG